MKVSKARVSENRHAILDAAASQLRERGMDQISMHEVALAAGLTHGALYSHFASKDALKAAATQHAFDETIEAFTGLPLTDFLDRYLSRLHRDNPAHGCPNAAMVSEVSRQPVETQKVFSEGLEQFVSLTGAAIEANGGGGDRDRAITLFATLVGGLALSRAIREVDLAGSNEILSAIAKQARAFADISPAATS